MDLDLNSVSNQKLPPSNPGAVYRPGPATVSPIKNCHCQQTLVRFTDLDFNSFSDQKLLNCQSMAQTVDLGCLSCLGPKGASPMRSVNGKEAGSQAKWNDTSVCTCRHVCAAHAGLHCGSTAALWVRGQVGRPAKMHHLVAGFTSPGMCSLRLGLPPRLWKYPWKGNSNKNQSHQPSATELKKYAMNIKSRHLTCSQCLFFMFMTYNNLWSTVTFGPELDGDTFFSQIWALWSVCLICE